MAYSGISKPSLHFNTKLYTGTGSAQNITGVGFQPDWVWTKQRSGTEHHNSNDAVRGATKVIFPNLNNAEQTVSNLITGFVSDGFSVGDNAGANNNGSTYASWNWKANGAGSSNTDGTINSTVSANTTNGFSIVKYAANQTAGATIGHGLGVAPKMIILKGLEVTENWIVYHEHLGNGKYMQLNGTQSQSTATNIWNDTSPTSSVFSIGNSGKVNNGTDDYIAYCFAEKKGYSKFGYYEGNGSTNGRFIYTGFKPAFIIYKRYDSGSYNWVLVDNKRGAGDDELIKKYFHPDTNSAEGSTTIMDFLSNGFKLRIGDTTSNQGSIVYMAFAEEPLVANVGNSIPATAR